MDQTYVCVWFHNCQAGRIVMSSSKLMPVVTRPRMTEEVLSQPPETFLKHVSDSHLGKLYDLPENIQDVMGRLPPIRLAEGFVRIRGTLSVGTGANEKSVQGSLRTGVIWYVPYV